MAKALAANGAKAVYILGRREASLQSAASQSPHGNIIPIVTDVSSQESLEAAAAKIRKEHGYVNAVIANAGVSGFFNEKLLAAGSGQAPFPTVEEYQKDFLANGMENMTKTLHMNTTAAFYTAVSFIGVVPQVSRYKAVPLHIARWDESDVYSSPYRSRSSIFWTPATNRRMFLCKAKSS